MPPAKPFWVPRRVLHGEDEPILTRLPADLISNLRSPTSEAALVWNVFYPLCRPRLSLVRMLSIPPLSGTAILDVQDDLLDPYFWGWSLDGGRLPGLDPALSRTDGTVGRVEADLILVGDRNLIVVEAKHLAGFGKCGRHESLRCPEVHPAAAAEPSCRYWEDQGVRFDSLLEFGPRPKPDSGRPPCAVHYQLARLLILGRILSAPEGRALYLWAVVPRRRWRQLQGEWEDFAGRVREEGLWRRLRVIAWEDLARLGPA